MLSFARLRSYTDYRRELDLDTALRDASRYVGRDGRDCCTRASRSPRPVDQVIVMRISRRSRRARSASAPASKRRCPARSRSMATPGARRHATPRSRASTAKLRFQARVRGDRQRRHASCCTTRSHRGHGRGFRARCWSPSPPASGASMTWRAIRRRSTRAQIDGGGGAATSTRCARRTCAEHQQAVPPRVRSTCGTRRRRRSSPPTCASAIRRPATIRSSRRCTSSTRATC